MRPLQWTVLATGVPPGGSLGGIVRYTTELIKALAAREDVVVSALTTVAAADTVAELIGESSRVRTVPNVPGPLLSIVERHAPLPGLHAGPDVVQGVKHLVPSRSSALRVLTIHDMLLLDRPADFPRAKRMLLPGFYRRSIIDADLLLCVSDASRRRVEAHVPAAAARAAVVHLATSESLRRAAPQAVAELEGRRFALVVGDSSPRKNLATAMTAWRQVRAAAPDAVLAVAGPPNWAHTEIGPLYDELVAAGAVLPLGQVSDGVLRWAYEHAAVVLCPSLAEGFGLPAAEALEFGAPVVISDDAALQEVAAGRARAVLPALAADRWAAAATEALAGANRDAVPTATSRTWAEVAADTVDAVRDALADRTSAAVRR